MQLLKAELDMKEEDMLSLLHGFRGYVEHRQRRGNILESDSSCEDGRQGRNLRLRWIKRGLFSNSYYSIAVSMHLNTLPDTYFLWPLKYIMWRISNPSSSRVWIAILRRQYRSWSRQPLSKQAYIKNFDIIYRVLPCTRL